VTCLQSVLYDIVHILRIQFLGVETTVQAPVIMRALQHVQSNNHLSVVHSMLKPLEVYDIRDVRNTIKTHSFPQVTSHFESLLNFLYYDCHHEKRRQDPLKPQTTTHSPVHASNKMRLSLVVGVVLATEDVLLSMLLR